MSFLNPQNAATATVYLSDKIVGVYRGSYAASSSTDMGTGFGPYRYAIPHSFTRPLFTDIKWSTDDVTYYDGGGANSGYTQAAIASSDSSNIYVYTYVNTGNLYYKIICTWIDDYDTTNPSISPVLDTNGGLYFDSRKNYPKIASYGTSTFVIGSFVTNTIAHGMSYVPRVKGYLEAFAGQVWPMNSGGSRNVWYYDPNNQAEAFMTVDTTNINIDFSGTLAGSGNRTVWYRIYI